MLYHTCTMISSVDLAHYGILVSCSKDWVSVDWGTNYVIHDIIKTLLPAVLLNMYPQQFRGLEQ